MNKDAVQQVLRLVQPPTVADSATLLERFRTQHDTDAFAALVHEHAGIVWRACRRVLTSTSDCEDVFQATFLVLWQQAQRIRRETSLGCWLHGVAYRMALQLQTANKRRQRREQRAARSEAAPEISLRDAVRILHEELQQLPAKYRDVLVLCYLEGRTRDEAASELGLTLNAVRGALERGREQLRLRLAKRGVTLSAALVTFAAGDTLAAPAALVQRVLAGTPTATINKLAKSALPAAKWPYVCAVALLLLVGVVCWQMGTVKAEPTPPEKGPVAKTDATAFEYRGQVVDAHGKPVAGAKVYLAYVSAVRETATERAVTDAQGNYRFTLQKTDFKTDYVAEPWQHATLFAKADGHALGWIRGNQPQLQLPASGDITGRFVDLEGKPLAGVQVRLIGLLRPKTGNLDAFIKAAQTDEIRSDLLAEHNHLQGFDSDWLGTELSSRLAPVQTDADGRFRLPNIGTESVVEVEVTSEKTETKRLKILTRKTAFASRNRNHATYFANDFLWPLPPGRTITGVVRDPNGKPLANAIISQVTFCNPRRNADIAIKHSMTTDANGRYTVHGMPLRQATESDFSALVAAGPRGLPYVPIYQPLPKPDGLKPTTVDFDLAEGTLLTVKAIHRETREPIRGTVRFTTNGKSKPGFAIVFFPCHDAPFSNSADNGATWQTVVPRLKGKLSFRADASTGIPAAFGEDSFDDETLHWEAKMESHPYSAQMRMPHCQIDLEPKDDQKTLEVTLEVDPGKKQTGKVLFPEGTKPAPVVIQGLRPDPFEQQSIPLKGDQFTVWNVRADDKRVLVAQCVERQLVGYLPVKADQPGDIKLVPWATLRGRAVNANGEPLANAYVVLHVNYQKNNGLTWSAHRVRADANGKFEINGIVPEIHYQLEVRGNNTNFTTKDDYLLKPGEERNLGDVKPPKPQ